MNLRKSFLALFFLINTPLLILTFINYQGTKIFYLFYSIISFIFFIKLTDKKSFLFENFVALYFFLGYWFSFSLKLSFFEGNFFDYSDGYGLFDFKKSSFDNVLLVCGTSLISFLVANTVKDIFIKKRSPQNIKYRDIKYFNNEYVLSLFFLLFIFVISLVNFKLNIYQRGVLSNDLINPLVINLFKWTLNFGYLVLISFALFYLIKIKSNFPNILTFSYVIMEFLINLSLMSRGMIFNGSATLWGIKKLFKKNYFLNLFVLFIILTFLFLFNILNIEKLRENNSSINSNNIEKIVMGTSSPSNFEGLDLLITTLVSRLHGFEAVMAVSAIDNKNFSFLKEALKEKNINSEPSFFDKIKLDPRKHLSDNQVSMTVPGLIAFLYYTGSLVFVFFSIFLISLFFCYLEKITFYFSEGNFIFVSLISQLSAYRLWHFGHNPSNSYLFLFSIVLSIILVYFLNKIFKN